MKKSLLTFLLFVAVQIIVPLTAMVFSALSDVLTGEKIDINRIAVEPVFLGRMLLVGNLVLIALLYMLKLIRPIKAQKLFQNSTPLLVWGLTGTLLLSLGISMLLTPLEIPDDGMMKIFDGMKGDVLCILSVVIVGPLAEELVFREGILRSLWEKRWTVWYAAIVSSLLFAVVHGNLAQAIPAALLGFVLGLQFARTGNISICFPAHLLNNGFAVLELYFLDEDFGSNIQPAILIAGGLLCCTAALLIFHYKLELTKYLTSPYKQ